MKTKLALLLLLSTPAFAAQPCTIDQCPGQWADRDNPPSMNGPVIPAPPLARPDGKGGVIFTDSEVISPAPVVSEVDALKHQVKRLKVKVLKLTAENIKLRKRARR